jgi:hypothetical protein
MAIHLDESPVFAGVERPAVPTELAPGEFVYGVLGDVVRDLEPEVLVVLVSAIQRGDPWASLPPVVRQVLAELDGRLFDEGE